MLSPVAMLAGIVVRASTNSAVWLLPQSPVRGQCELNLDLVGETETFLDAMPWKLNLIRAEDSLTRL